MPRDDHEVFIVNFQKRKRYCNRIEIEIIAFKFEISLL